MPCKLIMLSAILACWTICHAGWVEEPTPEQRRMIEEGMLEALDASLPPQRTVDQLSWLARAARTKAMRQDRADTRQTAWEETQTHYRNWIGAFDRATGMPPMQRATGQALARMEWAETILSGWASPLLDEFEITGGRRGDTAALTRLLQTAAAEHRAARAGVADLLDRFERSEDEFLAAGVHQGLSRLRLDGLYQSAWTNLYLAQTLNETRQRDERTAALRAADEAFGGLIDRAAQGNTQQRCRLGRTIIAREAGKAEEAERQLRDLLAVTTDSTLRTQARYELVRALAAQEKFAEARESILQLINTDVSKLLAEEQGARFYVDLARLWDGNLDLIESAALRRRAEQSTAREPLLQQAAAKRAQGLSKLDKLRDRGGEWPAIVQSYVLDGVNLDGSPRQMATIELLYAARALRETGRVREALVRLEELTKRAGVSDALLGDAQFEIGVCQFESGAITAAAAEFARFTRERTSHPRAAQAATNAFRLYARLAAENGRAEDYERLAGVLLHLVQSFPQHPDRGEAQWWLPVALQKAGKYAESAAQFANVPGDHPRYEEARFQRLVSERMAFEAERDRLPQAELANRARRLAEQLDRFAHESLPQTEGAVPDAQRERSAEARILAAELLMLQGIEDDRAAGAILSRFEQDHPNSPLTARALGVRIRAEIGAGRFDEALASMTRLLDSGAPERVSPILALIADGIPRELDRLYDEAGEEAAQLLANDAAPVFERLHEWCGANAPDAERDRVVRYGLARVYRYADRYEDAVRLARALLTEDERNGEFQRLYAISLEGALSADAPPAAVETVRDAWGRLLTDQTLKQRAPHRYWEARVHFLRMLLRLGRGAEVLKAIEQERVWSPDLGGDRWQKQFEVLIRSAESRTKGASEKP